MKKIPLTQGQFAIVDDEDFERVMEYKWCVRMNGRNKYAMRHKLLRKENDKWIMESVNMSNFILNIRSGIIVDHINNDSLDNRKSNLRQVTPSQNQQNKRPTISGTSKFKGVSWSKNLNKWIVHICKTDNGKVKRYHVGLFTKEKEAANAYNQKAKELFGEYAYLNQI